MKISHSFLITTNPKELDANDPRLKIDQIKTEVVSQFDFRNIDQKELIKYYDENSFRKRYGSIPSNGAIGCATAHRYCYQTFIDGGGQLALIMEDDIVFECNITSLIENICTKIIDFDLINLKATYGIFQKDKSINCEYGTIHQASLCQYGAHAYLITRDCANRFLKLQKPKIKHLADWPLETWSFRSYALDTDFLKLSGRPSNISSSLPTYQSSNIVHKLRILNWNIRKNYRIKFKNDLKLPKN